MTHCTHSLAGLGRLFALVLVCLGTGCPNSPTAPGTSRLQIVATTAMVAEMTRTVVGDRADVTALMHEGVDPHLYKPTGADSAALLAADVIVYSGLHLEGQLQEQFDRFAAEGRAIIAVSDGLVQVRPELVRTSEQFEGRPDPHIWHDPSAWADCVPHLVAKLSQVLPDQAADLHQNGQKYVAELQLVDKYIQEVMATIPAESRHLVTAHDAFEYFSLAYRIPVRAPQGISTESQAGVKDVTDLVNFLVENKIPAIFGESSVNDRNLRAIIEGADKSGWKVKLVGPLYSDALGAPGTYEGTYVGMMDHNASLIATSLGGSPPAGGFREWQKSQPSPE